MLNQLIYDFALWLDASRWSTLLHESYYMYNWVETAHVLSLVPSLGILFFIDLRMLGVAFPEVPATTIARHLRLPMFIGFGLMIITGLLLFYAIPVRSSQSVWFRLKFLLLIGAGINALVFHYRMQQSVGSWNTAPVAPANIRAGALLSLLFWSLIVICGRLIAYDWYDCVRQQSGLINLFAGCIDGQSQF
ncbi:MAG: hypothetical protein DRQ54_07835 [Gammaproteobacteria bacterium]|nr:MAG: hypothetical protein DRQ54_07835 [Gammaproteobacteria bacterium]RLA13420.1 MAG: hypothetical protein DRQ52_06295 [Gammaproteobacteria bacterium]